MGLLLGGIRRLLGDFSALLLSDSIHIPFKHIPTCVHTHTYTRSHTLIHMHACTCTHAGVHTHSHTQTWQLLYQSVSIWFLNAFQCQLPLPTFPPLPSSSICLPIYSQFLLCYSTALYLIPPSWGDPLLLPSILLGTSPLWSSLSHLCGHPYHGTHFGS